MIWALAIVVAWLHAAGDPCRPPVAELLHGERCRVASWEAVDGLHGPTGVQWRRSPVILAGPRSDERAGAVLRELQP